jgi:predicted nucleic acid-binding protein
VRALLDTNVLVAMPDEVVKQIDQYRASTVSRAELEFGVSTATLRGQDQIATMRRLRLEALDDAGIWVAFDERASREYGAAAARVLAGGAVASRARHKDGLIAAHALALGVPVMTRRAADLERFGVDVLVPPADPVSAGAVPAT